VNEETAEVSEDSKFMRLHDDNDAAISGITSLLSAAAAD